MVRNTKTPATTLIPIKEVLKRTGQSRTNLYRLIARKKFPASKKMPGGTKRFWPEHEVEKWINEL